MPVTKVVSVEIHQYLTHVKMAEKVRPKYLKWLGHRNKRVAKKNLPLIRGPKGLALNKNGEKILTNPQTANKPRFKKLSGNNFFSGYGHPLIRAKLAGTVKDDFIKSIKKAGFKKIPASMYPLRIEWDVYCPEGKKPYWDLDNLWFYKKFFLDALRACGRLEEDDFKHITDLSGPRWFPVETLEERKFVFRFMKDDRKEVR